MRDELCGCGEDKKKGVEITERTNCTKKNGVPSGLCSVGSWSLYLVPLPFRILLLKKFPETQAFVVPRN